MPATLTSVPRGRARLSPPGGGAVLARAGSRTALSPSGGAAFGAAGGSIRLSHSAALAVVGPQRGPVGPPGEGIEIEIYLAAAALGGHRAVALADDGRLVYASAPLGRPAIGILRAAVDSGGEVAVHRRGRVGGFSVLVPGAVYFLGASGLLSLTPPVAGMLQPLGRAASATELLVDPDYPVFL